MEKEKTIKGENKNDAENSPVKKKRIRNYKSLGENSWQKKSNKRKKASLIVALKNHLGVVTNACAEIGINPKTFYEWHRLDESFRQEVDKVENTTFDFVESALHKQIKRGNIAGIIFYLKTKGKKRGYVERIEVSGLEKEELESLKELARKEMEKNV